jgi:N-sulfoglucosamine sulfohydrolase
MSRRLLLLIVLATCCSLQARASERPNILLAISDDQSYPHASAYGYQGISTPAFDRVAREGVLFTNAFAASPGCSPCRAALLTGRHCWQIEHAGTHASWFPLQYPSYPEVLAENGYFVGHTGKGWGPGRNYGRRHNPAGPAYSKITSKPPYSGIRGTDYAANFAAFLEQKPDDAPFCFWYGASEPHRAFEKGSWRKAGKNLDEIVVPDFLPDTPEVRADIADYLVEIEHFDAHLGRMLEMLEAAGELDNTLVIVTSDNGMAFPRAKANCYEDGIHMPLAVRWGNRATGGRTVDDLIGFVDLTATILEAAGIDWSNVTVEVPSSRPNLHPEYAEKTLADSGRRTQAAAPLAGRSIIDILESDSSGVVDGSRKAVFSSRERHSSSRYQNLAYPQRAMRTADYLYIRNFRPARWPAGPPQKYDRPPRGNQPGVLGSMHDGYHDIDACPTLDFLIARRDDAAIGPFLHLAVDHRPAEELFDIRQDPACLHNLADDPEHAETLLTLREECDAYLKETGDPRALDDSDIAETYRRYSPVRSFPTPEPVQQSLDELAADGWQSLFNGRDLDGWKLAGPEGSFEAVDGMIKAQATADEAHLFYVGDVARADFTDFELLIDCMTTPGSNGGVYFHTSYQQTGFPNDGHEVQVNTSHHNRVRTGSLFSVINLEDSPVPDNVFYTQHIIVRSRHVTVKVNGEAVIDYTEPEGYSHPTYTGRNIDRGTFALQAHDPESLVYYRNIHVRHLPPEDVK